MRHVVFANTGIQVVCVPLKDSGRLSTDATGLGWQYCVCRESDGNEKQYRYLQWQILQRRLFFAIDTTCGDTKHGYFSTSKTLAQDFEIKIEGLLDRQGSPLPGVPPLEIVIHPARIDADAVRDVHVVVDFGNSRTGALLIEPSREATVMPLMKPFELVDRYRLNAWDENGNAIGQPSGRWFSSRTQWSRSPYLLPQQFEETIYPDAPAKRKGGIFGGRDPAPAPETRTVQPRLFQDLSAARMGKEGDEVVQLMDTEGTVRTGVSSPKRYLWADDASWLEGAIWRMADPTNRDEGYASKLNGPLFRYLTEDDADELRLPPKANGSIPELITAEEPDPPLPTPRHSPRVMMVAALYEVLVQAYAHINSESYRNQTEDRTVPREIKSLILTYPSGMIHLERERLKQQAEKAIDIFHSTVGRTQDQRPVVTLSIDEASAVHLTYIWSEMQLLGGNPKLWFDCVGRESDNEPEDGPPPTKKKKSKSGKSMRVACIDIGGGTSDLMIAKYTLTSGFVKELAGEVLHKDGISVAGDQLVKRLLECIIVPGFIATVNLEPEDAQHLFGKEWHRNIGFPG